MPLRILSPSEQVAAHLRRELLRGTWRLRMPGTPALAAALRVDRKTVMGALQVLEEEGLILSQGQGKARRVCLPQRLPETVLNIHILPYENVDRQRPLVMMLVHQLELLGHKVVIADKTLSQLTMDVRRIGKYVNDHPADVWLPMAASRDVLEWFASQPAAVMAIFGHRHQVPIASIGPDKTEALKTAVDRLIELGHRRISMISRNERMGPSPGSLESSFLKTLQSHGIQTGSYHLPLSEDNPASFHACLAKLFNHTPPTALILDEPQFLFAAMQHLASRGLSAPRDVSLICGDAHALFDWCQPAISHIEWDEPLIVHHITHWVQNLSEGQQPSSATIHTPATFKEAASIGQVSEDTEYPAFRHCD